MAHDDEIKAENPASYEIPNDPSRRFWVTAACAFGGLATVGFAVPLINTLAPSEKARAAGAPVEVEFNDLPVGKIRTIEWRGKPVWIFRRSEVHLDTIKSQSHLMADPESKRPGFTPNYAKNEFRSRNPEYLICVGICTHLGCAPLPRFGVGSEAGQGLPSDWQGGFFCPCHGSTFDMAGRVFKNKPAPDNLEIPPHKYLSNTHVIVGIDENNKI
ncbi:MAG: ubiquinol-cytochrome c reductase iron-sulfur subunit [Bordetella sp.]|nr:MAG: ubiquinol-cytochrome c reductase iron-sulfur subunit [Bordetella sp.]